MNNEEKILAMLSVMHEDIKGIHTRLDAVDGRLDALEGRVGELEAIAGEMKRDVKAIYEQTADLTEFEHEMKRKMQGIMVVIKENNYDITMLKGAINL